MDTIFALSSGSLPCGVAIIRVSGDKVLDIVKKTAEIINKKKQLNSEKIKARYMYHSDFIDENGFVMDNGMFVYFAAPNSFTGEDVVEFHIHGSKATVAKFLDFLSHQEGTRSAKPGEFSRRSFLNGKIDLVQAESLADLLEAETESQRRLSIIGASKEISNLYKRWHQSLLNSMALLTADLDFSDQEDTYIDIDNIINELKLLQFEINNHIELAKKSEILKNGLKIILIGKPNAGKSSFLNNICGENLSIVTSEAGTTRDIIKGKLNIKGIDIYFYDTAGIREAENEIEKIGIDLAKQKIADGDLIFLLSEDPINEEDLTHIPVEKKIWLIKTKSDIKSEKNQSYQSDRINKSYDFSIFDQQLSQNILSALEQYCSEFLPSYGDLIPVRNRHIENLTKSSLLIEQALAEDILLEIKADLLQLAANNIAAIIGKIDIEKVLDTIFSQFCIGK